MIFKKENGSTWTTLAFQFLFDCSNSVRSGAYISLGFDRDQSEKYSRDKIYSAKQIVQCYPRSILTGGNSA